MFGKARSIEVKWKYPMLRDDNKQRREDSRIYIWLEDVRSDLPGDGHRYLMYHLAVHLPSASTVILPAFMTVSAPRRDLLRRGFV